MNHFIDNIRPEEKRLEAMLIYQKGKIPWLILHSTSQDFFRKYELLSPFEELKFLDSRYGFNWEKPRNWQQDIQGKYRHTWVTATINHNNFWHSPGKNNMCTSYFIHSLLVCNIIFLIIYFCNGRWRLEWNLSCLYALLFLSTRIQSCLFL